GRRWSARGPRKRTSRTEKSGRRDPAEARNVGKRKKNAGLTLHRPRIRHGCRKGIHFAKGYSVIESPEKGGVSSGRGSQTRRLSWDDSDGCSLGRFVMRRHMTTQISLFATSLILSSLCAFGANTPPSITAQPTSASVAVGSTATFKVTVTGTAPLK